MTKQAASPQSLVSGASGPGPPRRRELDFLRGVALVVMTVGHPLRADVWVAGVVVDPARLFYNHYGELFSGLFMFISGLNVTNFLARAKNDPGLDAGAFYLKSSLLLFLMGWTYNLCVGTALFIDIIQCIALGTLVTYFLLRLRVPTWGLALFTAAVFVIGLAAVGPGPVTDETMARIRPYRYLVAFFGPFPWVGFFTFGVVADRLRGKKTENAVLILCFLLILAAHALPPLRGTSPAVHLLKANARYLVMSIGLLPLILILSKRYYKGISPIGRTVEFWGRESLVFLVFHWFYIFLLGFPQGPIRERFGESAAVWFAGFATMIIMAATVRPIARLRNRWLRHRRFAPRAWIVFVGAMLGWGLMMKRLVRMAHEGGWAVADMTIPAPSASPLYLTFLMKSLFAFLAAFSFCFLYPYLRQALRRSSRKRVRETA